MTTRRVKYGVKELEKEIGPLTFANLLSCYRLCEEMSQKEFAKLLGISLSSLYDLEKGKATPSIAKARKIAKKLQASEKLFMEMAIEAQLKREGLKKLKVSFDKA